MTLFPPATCARLIVKIGSALLGSVLLPAAPLPASALLLAAVGGMSVACLIGTILFFPFLTFWFFPS